MTADSVTRDRIKPGAEGGRYRRENLRPACMPCQSTTGGVLGAARKAAAAAPAVRRCRGCGCTDDQACPGGCWWVGDDLCSACGRGQPGDVLTLFQET